MSPRHLLDVDDLSPAELDAVLAAAACPTPPQVLAGRGAALLFEKPSARTRHATEMAVVQLGGHPVVSQAAEVGLDTREPAEDVARLFSRYHALIAARVFEHHKLERMAAVSTVPVVNLLSDDAHPMQALADLLTMRELLGDLSGRTVAYVGDHNNVARSLGKGAALAGMRVRFGCPVGFGPDPGELEGLLRLGAPDVAAETDPAAAVAGADVVYTDVWTSMGQESEAAARRAAFAGFCIDDALLANAAADVAFLHCLPAHRGEEVSAEVIDGPRSHVWLQAENRLHAARGLFAWLLGAAAP